VSAPKRISIKPPYNPTIPLLHIYPKEVEAGTQTGICTLIFIEYYSQ
jgi:hypothetical protein